MLSSQTNHRFYKTKKYANQGKPKKAKKHGKTKEKDIETVEKRAINVKSIGNKQRRTIISKEKSSLQEKPLE